jgi:hypothetical protein
VQRDGHARRLKWRASDECTARPIDGDQLRLAHVGDSRRGADARFVPAPLERDAHQIAADLVEWAGRVHPRFRTPHVSTIVTAIGVAIAAGLTPINALGNLVSIGTLMAFVIVSIGVIVLRRTRRICRGRSACRSYRCCRRSRRLSVLV